MFYEGRVTKVWDIDTDEINKIFTGGKLKHVKRKDGSPEDANLYAEILYRFKHNGKTYGFANDATDCEGIVELAILDMDRNVQIESLTIGWSKLTKERAILNCCENPMLALPTGIILGANNEIAIQPKVTFTCGCCGAGFKSTYQEQRKFDQDMGYGICDECANDYW